MFKLVAQPDKSTVYLIFANLFHAAVLFALVVIAADPISLSSISQFSFECMPAFATLYFFAKRVLTSCSPMTVIFASTLYKTFNPFKIGLAYYPRMRILNIVTIFLTCI